METMESGDDTPQEKCWRADGFVAKASLDELTRSWLVDENGQIEDRKAIMRSTSSS